MRAETVVFFRAQGRLSITLISGPLSGWEDFVLPTFTVLRGVGLTATAQINACACSPRQHMHNSCLQHGNAFVRLASLECGLRLCKPWQIRARALALSFQPYRVFCPHPDLDAYLDEHQIFLEVKGNPKT
jgi:hypothetical protein